MSAIYSLDEEVYSPAIMRSRKRSVGSLYQFTVHNLSILLMRYLPS